jgi:hypothetical protein
VGVAYFSFFTLLLVLSAFLIFESKIGISANQVLEYYLGSEERFIPKKTSLGILKISLPHIFAYGLITMVLLHFLFFTAYKEGRQVGILLQLMFLSASVEIASPLFMVEGYEFFAYIKLISFFMFNSLIVYAALLLLYDVANKKTDL